MLCVFVRTHALFGRHLTFYFSLYSTPSAFEVITFNALYKLLACLLIAAVKSATFSSSATWRVIFTALHALGLAVDP